ncbi:uncharacterized protein EI90DRAFT_3078916 [Cantharellus anzutake]|uniref:uncharacterized protein n=1 Tax=Cantharellus anzutake TaxID=1750568 RepID=UPI001905A192|nr:uncharacterized protein EI90DRAFT_3078916 [Cantharellus anzutake]KAF8321853.1 hypothetical protein EI90DRAFT_3078916 [Cantharellus anzutake]
MPSRCFVCRVRGKGCTESPDSRPCDPCSRMRVECIACPMAIPGVVRRSARARECLLEVKRLAEPGRTGIARLPKTRRLLLDLQPILGDSTSQSAADEGDPAQPTAALSITTPPADEPPYPFPMGSSVRDVNFNEESLDLRAQTLFPLSDHGSGEGFTSIVPTLSNMMPSFPQFSPDSEMAFPLNDTNPMLLGTFHHTAIPDQTAWPSRPGPSHIVAPLPPIVAPEILDRLQDRRTENEGVVFWLRGLAQRLGYRLVPF